MGKSVDQNGFAPFQINYAFTDLDEWSNSTTTLSYQPLNPSPIPCNSVPPGLDPNNVANTCPCQECDACMESAGKTLLDSVITRLSSYERKRTPTHSFSLYKLSTCETFALLLYISIVILVLVYFLVFNTRDKSSYDGKRSVHCELFLICLSSSFRVRSFSQLFCTSKNDNDHLL